jgi:hypothetical protein
MGIFCQMGLLLAAPSDFFKDEVAQSNGDIFCLSKFITFSPKLACSKNGLL